MDWTYLNTLKEAQDRLSMNFPKLSKIDKEISTLGWVLTEETLAGMLLLHNNHHSIMTPILALQSTDYLTEELMFLPSDVPRHLIPSFSTSTANS